EAVYAILEHEAMHQETLLYMWQQLPHDRKRRPDGYEPRISGVLPRVESVNVPAGRATLGVSRDAIGFGWDNEFPAYEVDVPAFAVDRHNVTNARYLEFVDAGGYQDTRWWSADDWAWLQRERIAHPSFWERRGNEWLWRGMFASLPLPLAWPVYVTLA